MQILFKIRMNGPTLRTVCWRASRRLPHNDDLCAGSRRGRAALRPASHLPPLIWRFLSPAGRLWSPEVGRTMRMLGSGGFRSLSVVRGMRTVLYDVVASVWQRRADVESSIRFQAKIWLTVVLNGFKTSCEKKICRSQHHPQSTMSKAHKQRPISWPQLRPVHSDLSLYKSFTYLLTYNSPQHRLLQRSANRIMVSSVSMDN